MKLMPDSSFETWAKDCTIPDQEVELDIAETERECKDFKDELDVLDRNPHENKLRIFFLRGKIGQRQEFIAKLKKLLQWRKENP